MNIINIIIFIELFLYKLREGLELGIIGLN